MGCPVLRESGQKPGGGVPGQRYSIIGADPAFLFRCTGPRVDWCARGETWIVRAGDPLAAFRDLLTRMAVPRPSGFPPFYGGAVGYFSYDVARWFERLPHPPPDNLGLPDLELAFLDLVAVADHDQKALWLIFRPLGGRLIKESREELHEEGQARAPAPRNPPSRGRAALPPPRPSRAPRP